MGGVRLLTATVLAFAAGPAAAQDWVPGQRFATAAKRAFAAADAVAGKTTLNPADGVCFLSGFLKKGEDVQFALGFDAGARYAVVAAGDDGAKDLDLVILDEKGTEVARDALADARPAVEFTTTKAARYTIKLVMPDAGANGGFGAVVILKAGGHPVTARDKEAAVANLLEECGDVVRRSKGQILFTSGANRWAVWGAVVRPGADVTVNLAPPGGGPRVWVTRGDSAAENLDSYLYSDTMKVLGKDEDDDARPRVVYQADAGAAYTVRVKNVRSRGPTLTLTATLTAD